MVINVIFFHCEAFLFVTSDLLKITNCVTGTLETKTGSSLVEFVTNCPNLTSLTLIRFGLTDEWARNLAEV